MLAETVKMDSGVQKTLAGAHKMITGAVKMFTRPL